MTEKDQSPVFQAVKEYYDATDPRYLRFLRGRCHYGLDGPINHPDGMERAQIKMEMLLGDVLGLPPGSLVFDGGSGYGRVAQTLSYLFDYHVVGFDNSAPRQSIAMQWAQSITNHQSLSFSQADFHRFPVKDNTGDGAFIMESLVHAADYQLVLQEIYRTLKPGGKLALFVYSIPPLDSVPLPARILAEKFITITGMASLPSFTHGVFPKILTDAGFEKINVMDISTRVYPSWKYMYGHAWDLLFDHLKRIEISPHMIAASMFIYPGRHWLRYNICTATKPL